MESLESVLKTRVSSLEKDMRRSEKSQKNEEAESGKMHPHSPSDTDRLFIIDTGIENKLNDLDTKLPSLTHSATQPGIPTSTPNDLLFQKKLEQLNVAWQNLSEKIDNISTAVDVLTSTSHSSLSLFQEHMLENTAEHKALWTNLTDGKIERLFSLMKEKLKIYTSQANGSCCTKDILDSVNNLLHKVGQQAPPVKDIISDVAELLNNHTCKRKIIVDQRFTLMIPPIEITRPYLCDQVTDGGGWIVILRRRSRKDNFYRNWHAYKEGFGSVRGKYWLGNEIIHQITTSGKYEVRVDVKVDSYHFQPEEHVYAVYDFFSLDSEIDKYTLRLGEQIDA
ncbi:ficolin 1 [Plakobranchus ocellatus]|uniref:Ficolin 1 n=1 Tax=Plakobranchus ocellatus TaxID=259542 RepID=A0AAV4DQK1_9GAST|nr:ficolin 1 [Plakobranchus ocellatus]